MKIRWTAALPFLATLAFSLGCVVFSCVTPSPFHVNTGKDGEGRIRTTQVFSRIDKIVVIDFRDRAKRTEIPAGGWIYDEKTTLLSFARELPYKDPVVHVEGAPLEPATFVVKDFHGDEESLFVVLGDRLAIQDYDYRFDSRTCRLVFRDGLDPEKEKFFISYDTKVGSSSFGNLDAWKDDRLAYLEAEHRARTLKRWYASREEFWFFEEPRTRGETPRLVKRRPTPEERKAMESCPVAVMKFRFGSGDEKVSREVGFDVGTPKEIPVGKDGTKYVAGGKFIEETSGPSGLRRTVSEFYRNEAVALGAGGELIVKMSAGPFADEETEGPELVIQEAEIDLGLPVRKRVVWAQRVRGGLDEKPDVVRLACYEWIDRGARFRLDVDDGVAGVEDFIAELISFRK